MILIIAEVPLDPHYAGENWKRRFHLEKASDISFHTTPEWFEKATSTGCSKARVHTWGLRPILCLLKRHLSRKPPFSKRFPSTLKRYLCYLCFCCVIQGTLWNTACTPKRELACGLGSWECHCLLFCVYTEVMCSLIESTLSRAPFNLKF